jgi:hypothetical protein
VDDEYLDSDEDDQDPVGLDDSDDMRSTACEDGGQSNAFMGPN